MDIAEYSTYGREQYAELAETVATILKAAIQHNGRLRLQEIQRRAKGADSLLKKLALLETATGDVAIDVKDLAGCRLVFYTNADVTSFLNAGIIQENFEVDWGRTKIHYPSKEDPDADELFHSHNYVVRLKEPRVDLPEHAHLGGLWCEVQVQTTLNHAWSEMAHDTIYKKPELNGFGAELMKGIRERMTSIMRDYLLPAGYEFQKVVLDFERLSEGKDLFDRRPLEALRSSTNNNERFDILSRFLDTVLAQYDDIEGEQEQIRAAMVDVVQASRDSAPRSIETPFGTLEGKSAEDVSRLALEVIDQLRYLGEDATRLTWKSLVSLYPGASSDSERKRILDSVHGLAKNHLRVWEEAGPIVQEIVSSELLKFSTDEQASLRPIVLKAIGAMQNLEAEASSFKADTFTLSRGLIPHSQQLEAIRDRCFQILRKLLVGSATDTERREVMACLRQGTSLPSRNATDALLAMVVRDAARLTELIADLAPSFSFELRQQLEHDALWDFRRLMTQDEGSPPVSEREGLSRALMRLREVLASDSEFQLFKVLVGFTSVFEPAWADPTFEVHLEESYRQQKRKEIISGIKEADSEAWHVRLLRCAGTDASDGATMPPFVEFLRELGETKPRMVLSFIADDDPRWQRFVPQMLKGVELGGLAAEVREIVVRWIESGYRLSAVANYLETAEPFDASLIARVTQKALTIGDDTAVLCAIPAISKGHRKVDAGLWPLFLAGISYLLSKGDARWVTFVWARTKEESIFHGLTEVEAVAGLQALRQLKSLNYQTESALAWIAEDWPQLVVDYLADRVRASRDQGIRQYEALPHGFSLLHKVLGKEPARVLAAARQLFDEDRQSFRFRGSLLVGNTFPKYTQELDRELLDFARVESEDGLQFLATILGKYHSEAATYPLCSEIIARSHSDDTRTDIRTAMTTFGMMGGEYGYADAHQRVRDGIEPWLSDTRESVRVFAKEFAHQLEQTIASERRSAQLRTEQRKRS